VTATAPISEQEQVDRLRAAADDLLETVLRWCLDYVADLIEVRHAAHSADTIEREHVVDAEPDRVGHQKANWILHDAAEFLTRRGVGAGSEASRKRKLHGLFSPKVLRPATSSTGDI
jgi:hypothetical protein